MPLILHFIHFASSNWVSGSVRAESPQAQYIVPSDSVLYQIVCPRHLPMALSWGRARLPFLPCLFTGSGQVPRLGELSLPVPAGDPSFERLLAEGVGANPKQTGERVLTVLLQASVSLTLPELTRAHHAPQYLVPILFPVRDTFPAPRATRLGIGRSPPATSASPAGIPGFPTRRRSPRLLP